MPKCPNDRKNLERQAKLRYAVQSGQSSIHGDVNYEIETQEAQSFGFYASTGQGASEGGGPGTGKHVLYTPGSSTEVLGEGLKVRKPGDISQLPAKIIKAKRGDMIFECENGNILLRAKNVFIDANGGGQDGQINLIGTRIISADAPDIRLQGEKVLIDATNRCDIISKGFFQLKYGFSLAAAHSDVDFGVLAQTLKNDVSFNPRTTEDN